MNYLFKNQVDAVAACQSFYNPQIACNSLWLTSPNKVVSTSAFSVGNEAGFHFSWNTTDCKYQADINDVNVSQSAYLGQCLDSKSVFFQFEQVDLTTLLGYLVLSYVLGWSAGIIKVWIQRGIEII